MATLHDRNVLNSVFNQLLPVGNLIEEDKSENKLKVLTQEEKEVIELEKKGVRLAEAGDLTKSIKIFTNAAKSFPNRASLYNNRAQAHRLSGNTSAALKDLETALTLSDGKGYVASQSYCQRALLKKLLGQEAEAQKDFEEAAALGNPFAKEQLTISNPYAALCNHMLSQMMTQFKTGGL